MRSVLDGLVRFQYNNDTYYYLKNAKRNIIGILVRGATRDTYYIIEGALAYDRTH